MKQRPQDSTLSFYKDCRFLNYKQFSLQRDILRIAFAMFLAENEHKKSGRIEEIEIYLSRSTAERIDADKLSAILKELFLMILLEEINIVFIEVDDESDRVKKEVEFDPVDAVVLFSAGVDSYAGIRVAEKRYEKLVGLFVAHDDQARIIKIVNEIRRSIRSDIRTVYAPSMGSTGYSQLRGFLYVLSAGAYMTLYGTRTIILTECGPTMYQPMFSVYDSITYTTHPYVMTSARVVLSVLLGYEPNIIIPFEDLTKAEVIAISEIKDFSRTHSCITQRFGNHDGTCFGCVIKKLAASVAGVKDVAYKKDFLDDNSNQDNILNVLEYSEDLLNDYARMPDYQIDKIEEFGKHDLFRRYAMDNLAGLMIAGSKKNQLYRRFVKDEKKLAERISQVRERKYQPDFGKLVNGK